MQVSRPEPARGTTPEQELRERAEELERLKYENERLQLQLREMELRANQAANSAANSAAGGKDPKLTVKLDRPLGMLDEHGQPKEGNYILWRQTLKKTAELCGLWDVLRGKDPLASKLLQHRALNLVMGSIDPNQWETEVILANAEPEQLLLLIDADLGRTTTIVQQQLVIQYENFRQREQESPAQYLNRFNALQQKMKMRLGEKGIGVPALKLASNVNSNYHSIREHLISLALTSADLATIIQRMETFDLESPRHNSTAQEQLRAPPAGHVAGLVGQYEAAASVEARLAALEGRGRGGGYGTRSGQAPARSPLPDALLRKKAHAAAMGWPDDGCWECGQRGHDSTKCPSRQRGGQRGGERGGGGSNQATAAIPVGAAAPQQVPVGRTFGFIASVLTEGTGNEDVTVVEAGSANVRSDGDGLIVADSGCGLHHTGDITRLQNRRPVDHTIILQYGSGEQLRATEIGTMTFPASNGKGGFNNVSLSDVYYVPGCKYNLVSVGQIDKRAAVTMEDGGFVLYSKPDYVPVCTGRTIKNVYYFNTPELMALDAAAAVAAAAEACLVAGVCTVTVDPTSSGGDGAGSSSTSPSAAAAATAASPDSAGSPPPTPAVGVSVGRSLRARLNQVGAACDTAGTPIRLLPTGHAVGSACDVAGRTLLGEADWLRQLDRTAVWMMTHMGGAPTGEPLTADYKRASCDYLLTLTAQKQRLTAQMQPFVWLPPDLDAAVTPIVAAVTANRTQQAAQLQHRRFGHLGLENLAKVTDMVKGMGVPAKAFMELKELGVCGPCADGKLASPPHLSTDTAYTRPLELLHLDTCEMPLTARSGARYMLAVKDEATKLTVVRMVKTKDEIAGVVIHVIAFLERQSGHQLRAIRTDRGREFLNRTLGAELAAKGIQHDLSAPYTPQQNGNAERSIRTIVDRVVAMLADSGMPTRMWDEAAATAAYIINRSPARGLATTPYEAFYGRKPDVSCMRVFGCLAYVQVPKRFRNKLEEKTEKGVFVGYEPFSKSWRVLLPDGSVVVSAHVRFDENAVPWEERRSEERTRLLRLLLREDSIDGEPDWRGSGGGESDDPPAPDADGEEEVGGVRRSGRERRPPVPVYVPGAVAEEIPIPSTFDEAVRGDYGDEWRKACEEEMASLHAHGTWELVEPPPGVKPIPVRWVFTVKKGASGEIERFKARLVAKGFRQREGIDFDETFAPTTSRATLRVFLAMANSRGYHTRQLDVRTAFLNGELEETVYTDQPPGFESGVGLKCKLLKALYGLRQAPRAWHMRLKSELEKLGWIESTADAGLYIKRVGDQVLCLVMHVDDLLIAGPTEQMVVEMVSALGSIFDLRDLGEVSYYLGMEVWRDRVARKLKLTQRRFTEELLQKFGMEDAQPRSTPLSPAVRLEKAAADQVLPGGNRYAEVVGALMYLATNTRPDIAQAVGALARFMSAPAQVHYNAAMGVLRYLAGTREYGLCFTAEGERMGLSGFCDADYAGDLVERRSTTGYVFLVDGTAVVWSSKLQPTVAVSTVEAEYMAAAFATKEGLWLKKLMADLGQACVISILGDNQGALALMRNPICSSRTKHIDVRHHFVRERVLRGGVQFGYCPTAQMVADALTKPVDEGKFIYCREHMSVRAAHMG